MRHRLDKKSFNRDTKARKALLLAVATNVLQHGEIKTTAAKAKQAARLVEQSITIAKKGDLTARRQLHRLYGKRAIVNNLCDRVAPVFANRNSGFTRLTLIGNRRGDNTTMYHLSLVEVLPPTRKNEAEAKAKVEKIAKQAKKKERHGLLNRQKNDDQAAQEALKLEKQKEQRLTSANDIKAQQRSTTRTSVTGGGRGK
jgi:large subunit ribosomal protein L17